MTVEAPLKRQQMVAGNRATDPHMQITSAMACFRPRKGDEQTC